MPSRRGSQLKHASPSTAPPPPLWPWFALAACAALAYYPAWFGGMVWDDDRHLTAAALRGLEGLRRIWFELGATQQYYPLVHSAFWLQDRLWGDELLGYHLVNIGLHAISAGLVWRTLVRLAVPGALLSGFLFALHPVHVESVAWMTELKNTLSAVFVLLAALKYLDFDEARGSRSYLVALALFVFALLSKSVTAVLPAALLVVFWWKRGTLGWRRDVVPLVPFFALGAAAGLFTAWVERTYIGAQGDEFAFSALERVLIAGRVVWFYAATILWPANLVFSYPRWTIDRAVWWQYVFPAAAAILIAALWWIRGRTRGPLAAALLFGGILFPVLGFFNVYPFRFSFVADHFVYLASIPLLALASAGMARAADALRVTTRVRVAGATVLLAALAALTFQQARHYADAETLYRETLRRNPASWMAHGNLGMLLLERDPAAALQHLDEAVRLHPGVAESRLNRGNALQRLGRVREAVAEYREALRLDPGMAQAHSNLSNALFVLGQHAQAIEHAETALRLRPGFADAHYNAGRAARALGRYGDAVTHLNSALAANPAMAPGLLPELAQTHNELGVRLARDGRIEAAILALREAIRTQPGFADAHFNLATVLMGAGRPAEAVPHYDAAVLARPGDATAHNNLGAALEAAGRRDEAAGHYREAVRLDPSSAQFRANLARVTGR